jgi:glucose 1-dehydrogenase
VILAGKAAVVTGASRGIGKAIALSLAEAGADVAINYNSNRAEAEEVAASVRKLGRKTLLCQGDVSDNKFVDEMVAAAVREFGHLDIAVTNAAFSDREPFYEANLDGFRRTVNVTMWGAFNTLHAATRQMIKQGHGGSVVIISSPHAYIPVPWAMAYNMSKAAIDQMARTAAIELVDFKIRVNMIHPGWFDTPGERKFTSEEQIAVAAKELPWGRMGRPDEVGRCVVFLCDPASDYMTGGSLLIDGGNTLPWWAKGGRA